MSKFFVAAVGCALLASSSVLSAPILTGAVPTVTDITPNTGGTAGGTPITITGSGFGLASDPATIDIGSFSDLTAVVASDTEITGTLPEGEGANLEVQVTTLVGPSGPTGVFFSYNAPVVGGITPTSGSTEGGYSATITGSNFGTGVPTVFIGGNPAPPSASNHTSIDVTVPPGAGADQTILVSAGGQPSSGGATFDYDPPSISGITAAGAHPTAGGNTVNISGSNFSTSGAVTIGGTPVAGFIFYDHTLITAIAPAGVGINQPVVVSTEGQASTPDVNSQYSYDPPLISTINPNTGPQIGGIPIVLQGSNFGPSGSGQSVLFGSNPASVVSADHASMTVTLPPAGGLGVVDVSLTVGAQNDTATNGFDYDVVPVELSVFGTE